MGNRQSEQRLFQRERETLVSRVFYMVFGSPSIRYVHSRKRGPLIFDYHMVQDEEENSIQHAETLQLPSAVPSKQDFLLTPVVRGSTFEGYVLRFSLSTDNDGAGGGPEGSQEEDAGDHGAAKRHRGRRFPKYVSVYAGVRIEYIPGKGIRLQQDAESQDEPVVLDLDELNSTKLETKEPIHLHKLCRPSYTEQEEGNVAGSRRLLTAPICIAVRITCDGEPEGSSEGDAASGGMREERRRSHESDPPPFESSEEEEVIPVEGDAGNNGTAPVSGHGNSGTSDSSAGENRRQHGEEERKASPHKRPATFDVILYTFLDFPEDAYTPRRVSLPTTPSASHDPEDDHRNDEDREQQISQEKALTFKGHVVKQLLQVGVEVYELEDIYNLGADAEPSGAADDDDDDGNTCVVCLSNPKDTTTLPCRHMCLCYECATQVRLSANKCPVCRCTIERIMTI